MLFKLINCKLSFAQYLCKNLVRNQEIILAKQLSHQTESKIAGVGDSVEAPKLKKWDSNTQADLAWESCNDPISDRGHRLWRSISRTPSPQNWYLKQENTSSGLCYRVILSDELPLYFCFDAQFRGAPQILLEHVQYGITSTSPDFAWDSSYAHCNKIPRNPAGWNTAFELASGMGGNEYIAAERMHWPGKLFVMGGGVAECYGSLDLKSGGRWFKSSSLPLSGFVLGSPEFNSFTALCK